MKVMQVTEERSGKIQTVGGLIEPSDLGVTLTHEHLLIDLATIQEYPVEAGARGLYEAPVSAENLGYIRHYGMTNADNARVLDVGAVIEEVSLYRQSGGDTLVEATNIGIGRDPVGLLRISRATGVNIVMGGSFYVEEAHPSGTDARTEDDLTEQIVRDITEGVDGTGIKSGIIGEVGCSWPLTENERKVLRASARAQRITGAPLLIHPGRDETAPMEIIEVLSEAGADIGRTIMGHLDRTVFLKETLKQIAESGCYMEWDLFGQERSHYEWNPNIDMPNDAKRMDDIAWVISQGYANRVVIAHDLGEKHRMIKYGGHGFPYILTQVVPRMRDRGYTDEVIHKILVDNPAAILAFAEPRKT